MQVGRCRGAAPQSEGGPRVARRVVPLPSAPRLGSGGRRVSGRCPRELGEEGKSGARGSRPHAPGALWNEILINY